MIPTKPRRGDIAICSAGYRGLILQDDPKEITYADGNKATAYIGVHLDERTRADGSRIVKPGDPWSSRSPNVVGHVEIDTSK